MTFYVWGYCEANPHLSCGRFHTVYLEGDCFVCWHRWALLVDIAALAPKKGPCGGCG
jgi:hypothetical protein